MKTQTDTRTFIYKWMEEIESLHIHCEDGSFLQEVQKNEFNRRYRHDGLFYWLQTADACAELFLYDTQVGKSLKISPTDRRGAKYGMWKIVKVEIIK